MVSKPLLHRGVAFLQDLLYIVRSLSWLLPPHTPCHQPYYPLFTQCILWSSLLLGRRSWHWHTFAHPLMPASTLAARCTGRRHLCSITSADSAASFLCWLWWFRPGTVRHALCLAFRRTWLGFLTPCCHWIAADLCSSVRDSPWSPAHCVGSVLAQGGWCNWSALQFLSHGLHALLRSPWYSRSSVSLVFFEMLHMEPLKLPDYASWVHCRQRPARGSGCLRCLPNMAACLGSSSGIIKVLISECSCIIGFVPMVRGSSPCSLYRGYLTFCPT